MSEFRKRLCYVLVAEWLEDMELELVTVHSMRALARHPWPRGKRLRPIAFLLSYLAVMVERGLSVVERGREVRLAAALELLHEASLVHDDLVDRSSVRRGAPTLQLTSGAGRALLIGDYMVFRALKLVLDSATTSKDIELAQELAHAGLEIAHGQLEQLERYLDARAPEERMSMEGYTEIIGKKTAMFFAACTEGGAALGGGDRELRQRFHEFGLEMGLAFQMLDDLIDVIGDPERAAKSLRSNVDEGTVTLPFVHAYQLFPGDPALARIAAAEPLDEDARRHALELAAHERVIEACRATIAERAERAVQSWSALPGNAYTLGLHDLLTYILAAPWGGAPSLAAAHSDERKDPEDDVDQ